MTSPFTHHDATITVEASSPEIHTTSNVRQKKPAARKHDNWFERAAKSAGFAFNSKNGALGTIPDPWCRKVINGVTGSTQTDLVLHPLFKGKITCSLCGKTYTVNIFGKHEKDCAVLKAQMSNETTSVKCITSDVIVAGVGGDVLGGCPSCVSGGVHSR